MQPSLTSTLALLVEEQYVYPDAAVSIAAAVRRQGVDADLDAGSVASLLSTTLLAASNDRHLRVRTRQPPRDGDSPDSFTDRMVREARENVGGVAGVQRLEDGTGILTIRPYLSAAHLAAPYLDAAFTLLGGVKRLVIDVRAGVGGTPDTIALLAGYLVGDEPVHLQDVVERDGTRRQLWSEPSPSRLGPDVRIAVLTSPETFSGCEELAYDLQALGRALVVGERTRGGAHPVVVHPLGDALEVAIPVARSINATTGTSWEGCGVSPDVEVTAAGALPAALELIGAHQW